MATPDYDTVLKNNQEAASLSAKAAQEARDAYNQIINTKTVGTNGQLRALSSADTLADAPVGDAATVRNNIGAVAQSDLGALAKKDTLADAPVGDAEQLRKAIGLAVSAVMDVFSSGTPEELTWSSQHLATEGAVMGVFDRARQWREWLLNDLGVLRSDTQTTWGWVNEGIYQKHPDGTLICWHDGINQPSGETSTNWKFPFPFHTVPTVQVTQVFNSQANYRAYHTLAVPATDRAVIYSYKDQSASPVSDQIAYSCLAIGRWK